MTLVIDIIVYRESSNMEITDSFQVSFGIQDDNPSDIKHKFGYLHTTILMMYLVSRTNFNII